MEIKAGNLRKGMYVLFKNQPHIITSANFISPGKGSAFMRSKLKSIKTGNTAEFTFKSTESLDQLDVTSQQMQFLYMDAQDAVFMDQRSFEQVTVPHSLLDGKELLLTPDVTAYILFFEEKAIGLNFPPKVKLKVEHADESTAGNTVGQAKKNVRLETGLIVQAPLFVKTGDVLIIDTETQTYVSRA